MSPHPSSSLGRRRCADKGSIARRDRSRSRSLRRVRGRKGCGPDSCRPGKQNLTVDFKTHAASSRLKLVHISKCAGTSLENWGAQHGFQWGKRWPAIGSARKTGLLAPHEERMKSAPWHIPPRFFVDSPYCGFSNFAVVRNPYARAISEFRCPWAGFMAPVRGSCDRKKRRASATCADLNSWICKKLTGGVARPPFTNGHWIPQHLYVFDGDGQRVVSEDDVIRFEHLADGIAALLQRHGLHEFPYTALAKTNVSEMPSFNVKHLDGATCKLIEEAYAEDFVQFGYDCLPSSG